MFLVFNQTKARLLASNSTGNVITENTVVVAKSNIPNKNKELPSADPVADKISPIMITKLDNLLATPTIGTIEERMVNQE